MLDSTEEIKGFDRYYENALLASIQQAAGTTARGDDLVAKIRKLRKGHERAKRYDDIVKGKILII